jgi:hypothetical protein
MQSAHAQLAFLPSIGDIVDAKRLKSVKTAHLNLMLASDKDTEHTIGCTVTRRPTMDHHMVYVEWQARISNYALSTVTN